MEGEGKRGETGELNKAVVQWAGLLAGENARPKTRWEELLLRQRRGKQELPAAAACIELVLPPSQRRRSLGLAVTEAELRGARSLL